MDNNTKHATEPLFVSIDVGTRSVRGAVHSNDGRIVTGPEARNIGVYQDEGDVFEQCSTEIWSSVCDIIQTLCKSSPAIVSSIRGIGFDATCSLVVVGDNGQGLPVGNDAAQSKTSSSESAVHDIILWADHRAIEQAERINKLAEEGKIDLRTVGGRISPEMEPPKLLWLKENKPETYNNARHFFDLCDYLTWRCTGNTRRSMCSTVCKWQYSVDFSNTQKHGWNAEFWQHIGLGDLLDNNTERIGRDIAPPGALILGGLSKKAAQEFSVGGDILFPEGIVVATGIIDAHAGGLGMLFCQPDPENKTNNLVQITEEKPVTTRIAIIAGTSACHMASARQPVFVRGVWGPYGNAMLPNLWLNEAGQSAAGELIDHVVSTFGAVSIAKLLPANVSLSDRSGVAVFLNAHLSETYKTVDEITFACRPVLVYPDFHGNRSPFAEPQAAGIITGLRLIDVADAEAALNRLSILYVAAVQSLAYQTRKIMEALSAQGYEFSAVCMGGGLSKNWLYVQTHADVLGLPVLLSQNLEPMLVGSACLAAAAYEESQGRSDKLDEVCQRMGGKAKVVLPFGYAEKTNDDAVAAKVKHYHEKRYELTMNYLRGVEVHVRQELDKLK